MQIEIAEKDPERMYIRIPIVKATRKDDPSWAEVDLNALPEDVLKEVYLQGLKTLLNRGMSKITGEKNDASVKAVMGIAAQNLQNLYDGKIRMSAGVRTKITGVIKTEAMRIARQIIKDGLKEAGLKVSHYTAKEISKAAETFLGSEDGKEVWEEAKATVEARGKKDAKAMQNIKAIAQSLEVDPELVKKAAMKKKPKKEGSTDLAAIAAARKGQSAQHTHH